MAKKVAIAFMCCDARLHCRGVEAVQDVSDHIGYPVYPLTTPGPDRAIVHGTPQEKEGDRIRLMHLWHALEENGAEIVAVGSVSHGNCAGHPVSDDEHRKCTSEASKALRDDWGIGEEIFGLFESHISDSEWQLEEVVKIPSLLGEAVKV